MVYEFDPLADPRWPEFLRHQARASVFHTRGWLEALNRTYDFIPAALTTSQPGSDLANGLVICRVNSWLTGRRLVSLPFSDHCEPLFSDREDLDHLLAGLKQRALNEGCRSIEIRPTSALPEVYSDWRTGQQFYLHRLNLCPGADAILHRFHRDCIQRKIRRAEREGVKISSGRDPESVANFYRLVLKTRRRHGLPPQPIAWFRNVVECLGDSALVRLAFKDGHAIAGIVTLQYGNVLYYKYGASEARFHNLGAMPYLFWRAIQDAIAGGLQELDMGRSGCTDTGLVAFKEHLNAERSTLSYWRFPATKALPVFDGGWKRRLARQASNVLPDRLMTVIGTLLYRHMG